MKRLAVFLLSILAFSVFANISLAGVDFGYECFDANCMEGTRIDYHVYLVNTAYVTLEFTRLYLKNEEFNGIVDFDVSKPVVLAPNESRFYNLSREVKAQ